MPEVFLVGENGEQIGKISTFEALKKAQEAELDLIEVAPNVNPPVCKIGDFGQFQYNQNKKQKTSKPKKVETKCLRLTFKIGKHDLEVRRNQAEKFIKSGDRVKLEMMLRGRERDHRDLGISIIQGFIDSFGDKIRIDQPLKCMGGNISTIIKPK